MEFSDSKVPLSTFNTWLRAWTWSQWLLRSPEGIQKDAELLHFLLCFLSTPSSGFYWPFKILDVVSWDRSSQCHVKKGEFSSCPSSLLSLSSKHSCLPFPSSTQGEFISNYLPLLISKFSATSLLSQNLGCCAESLLSPVQVLHLAAFKQIFSASFYKCSEVQVFQAC